jgi:hypothetical protein
MNIRNKLLVLFVSIVALILVSASLAVYFFLGDKIKYDFYKKI